MDDLSGLSSIGISKGILAPLPVRKPGNREEDGGSPRWALPDLIATSKLDSYAWQDEFRLVLSLTNALTFENVNLRVEPKAAATTPDPTEHRSLLVKAGSLGDICRLRDL